MASGDTDLVKQLLAEAPTKTPHVTYKNKRVRQVLDSYLEYGTVLAPARTLGYTLYTVIPNPGRSLRSSWQEVEREWISVKLALESLGEVGVLCSFLGLEVHSAYGKKGKEKGKRKGAPSDTDPSNEEDDDLEQDDPAPPVPGQARSASTPPIHQQALKPHFHAVLVHDLTDPRLRDPAILNRLLMDKDASRHVHGSPPQFQDVQAKTVRLTKNGPTNSICYIFKASGDKLTEFLAARLCPSWTRPLVHLIYPSSSLLWTRSSMQQMIRLCNLYDPGLQLAVNQAALPPPGLWMDGEVNNQSVSGPNKLLQAAQRVGRYLSEQSIYYCDGHYVDRKPGTRAVWRLRYANLEALLEAMIRVPAYTSDIFTYNQRLLKLPMWTISAVCPRVTVAYHIFELEDCFMRHGRSDAVPGGADTWFAFIQEMPEDTLAAMKVPLRRDQCIIGDLYTLRPQAPDIRTLCPRWWGVIANAFRHMADPSDLQRYGNDRRDVERLVTMLAHSICRQNCKEKVPFLIGLSNTGKSSLVEPMVTLYGDSLKAVIQGSGFPLEKVPYARYLVFEEFRLNILPSNVLFQLLEHGRVTCDIKNHSAIEVNCDFGMASMSNDYPQFSDKYKHLQPALDNRLEYLAFNHPIPNPDKAARNLIGSVEAPYALMFMIMVYHGMQRWV